MTKWPSDRVTEWLSDWVTEWPSDRVTVWLCDPVTDWEEALQTIDRMVYFIMLLICFGLNLNWIKPSYLFEGNHFFLDLFSSTPSPEKILLLNDSNIGLTAESSQLHWICICGHRPASGLLFQKIRGNHFQGIMRSTSEILIFWNHVTYFETNVRGKMYLHFYHCQYWEMICILRAVFQIWTGKCRSRGECLHSWGTTNS